MIRRKPEFQSIDLSAWPSIAWTELDVKTREAMKRRIEAVERYARGERVKDIEKVTGVNRRQIYRWLERGLAPHPDGRIFGFRALSAHVRVNGYVRVSPVNGRPSEDGSGKAGAFALFLERFPMLAGWLLLKVKQRRVSLEQVHTDGRLQTRLVGLHALHSEFLWQCRSLGLTAVDYPFNTDGRAIRSLSARLKVELLRSFRTAARAAGATHLKGLPHYDKSDSRPATRPYQVVEFDGHRLDLRLKVVVRDALGFEHEFEIERVWLLAIIDVCTRAVLGYHLALGREYSRYDVIKTIESALEPHRPRDFTIPGLVYGSHDGFPSQRLPELAYTTWERIKLDNAKANLATETLDALCEFVGCCADAGPKYSPDDRPYIERFFGTIASRLSSRLPGYTGSHPRDLRRALADPKGKLRLFVSFDELEELVEYAIASYNGTPHASLNNVTPLEAMEYFIRGREQLLTWLPEHRRRTLCLMQSARRCTVRAYLDRGIRPHINLYGVRYTSSVLACSTDLIGKSLLIYLNVDDLRCVRAFQPDGAELELLEAQGAWGVMRHNLKLRQQINQEKKDKKRPRGGVEADPIADYVDGKMGQAKKTRKAASELAEAKRILSSAPTARTAMGRGASAAQPTANAAAAPTVDKASEPKTPTRPKKLNIGTGQVF
ncbi:helix-turn-helix domain-containing protein [Cupriavidus basilensis]|uniref:helix-turn-helix domain-containing protein n=1 Tax=Cupriavidus basilensis TaxID=68895 RepID=UPI0023E8D057|nr:helix-turn-helix domain-containing protein [Cupriavidus basilensis]MDF3887756.1 helix-turn-helix domain-containing protein [Cupriavidus basilensis]